MNKVVSCSSISTGSLTKTKQFFFAERVYIKLEFPLFPIGLCPLLMVAPSPPPEQMYFLNVLGFSFKFKGSHSL